MSSVLLYIAKAGCRMLYCLPTAIYVLHHLDNCRLDITEKEYSEDKMTMMPRPDLSAEILKSGIAGNMWRQSSLLSAFWVDNTQSCD